MDDVISTPDDHATKLTFLHDTTLGLVHRQIEKQSAKMFYDKIRMLDQCIMSASFMPLISRYNISFEW